MIADNVAGVMRRIASAAARAGRDPGAVTLVASTKGRSIEEIEEAVRAGVAVIGENRVQEARFKHVRLKGRAGMHMIGNLQRNKAAAAIGIFEMIHSVDGVKLAGELDRAARRKGRIVPVLLEVNISGEARKHGVSPDGLPAILGDIAAMDGLRVEGLMTMAPLVEDPEEARPIFRRLRELAAAAGRLSLRGVAMQHLSMGMTQDFEVAIEEGATMVRIGTAIFGEPGGTPGGRGGGSWPQGRE